MYEKQTWVSGEVITADKLNHMEDGIKGVIDIVRIKMRFTGTALEVETVDKTITEMMEGIANGIIYIADVDATNTATMQHFTAPVCGFLPPNGYGAYLSIVGQICGTYISCPMLKGVIEDGVDVWTYSSKSI